MTHSEMLHASRDAKLGVNGAYMSDDATVVSCGAGVRAHSDSRLTQANRSY
jgi:hypothetical protein